MRHRKQETYVRHSLLGDQMEMDVHDDLVSFLAVVLKDVVIFRAYGLGYFLGDGQNVG